MQLKVKTINFQALVARAVKGASNNKMLPITSLMAIELSNGRLTLTTTDSNVTLKVWEDNVTGQDFYACVPAELFSKLVAKTTAEHIELKLLENALEVKGNGTYKIELPLDEEGQIIKFPQLKFPEGSGSGTVNLSFIKQLVNVNEAALAETMETPCLTGYYCDDKEVISTDTFKVCGNKLAVFDRPVLISPEMMELLSMFTEEKITVDYAGSEIRFTSANALIQGTQLEGIEDYPVEAIRDYLQTGFSSKCKLPRAAVLNVLDRLSLFVTPYDNNGLNLTFTNEGVMISSKRSNGTELIKYQDSTNFTPFTCSVDIELLKSQISVQDTEVIELWYGHDKAIKMTCGNVTQIVALLEDEEVA